MAAPLNRTELINALVERIGARSYLEIGVNNGRSFAAIRCKRKVGVDPKPVNADIIGLTSDAFFAQNHETFDVIFIDGLHENEQVHRDVTNALAVLNEGGFIVCHDMNPWSEQAQRVPYAGGSWTGDCWKAFVRLRAERSDLEMCVVNIDAGCAVIRRGSQTPLELRAPLAYRELARHRRAWLNLVTAEQFDEWLRGDISTPLLTPPAPSMLRAALRAIGAAAALLGLALAVFLIIGFVGSDPLLFDPNLSGIVLSAIAGALMLSLAAPLAVRIGVYAVLPRPHKRIGPAIASIARVTSMLPTLLIGLFFGAALVSILYVISRISSQGFDALFVFLMPMLFVCAAMLLPTIVHATVRAMQALPPSLREPRFHPALTRGEFVRAIVLPNALPAIVPAIGIAFGRVCCDFWLAAFLTWVVLLSEGEFVMTLYAASSSTYSMFIASLLVNITAVWLINKIVPHIPSAAIPRDGRSSQP